MPRMAVVHLVTENAQLRAKLTRAENRWARTLEWFANPHMKPAEKVVGFNVLIHAGGAPGVLPQNPLSDVTPVVIAEIARISGLSAIAGVTEKRCDHVCERKAGWPMRRRRAPMENEHDTEKES
jgi:hypothetical protein